MFNRVKNGFNVANEFLGNLMTLVLLGIGWLINKILKTAIENEEE